MPPFKTALCAFARKESLAGEAELDERSTAIQLAPTHKKHLHKWTSTSSYILQRDTAQLNWQINQWHHLITVELTNVRHEGQQWVRTKEENLSGNRGLIGIFNMNQAPF